MTVTTLEQLPSTALRHTHQLPLHISPSLLVPGPTSFRREQILDLYRTYAIHADKFLECQWYSTDQAFACILDNKPLLASYSELLDQASDVTVLDDRNILCDVESKETQVIWETLTLCRTAPRGTETEHHGRPPPDDAGLQCALRRVDVLEALITGGSLETNPLEIVQLPDEPPANRGVGLGRQMKMRELEFWQAIGRYVTGDPLSALFSSMTATDKPSMKMSTGHDFPMTSPSFSAATTLSDGQHFKSLQTAREHLDIFENRDVIYSIAVARDVSQSSQHINDDTAISSFSDLDTIMRPQIGWSIGPSSAPVTTTSFSSPDIAQPDLACTADEGNPKSRLRVACRFLEDESRGQGTNQVIKRICGMVVKRWDI